ESYRKIRNTFRFLLSNLYDFNPASDPVPVNEMLEVDQWALARTAEVVEQCRAWYGDFAFHKVYHAIYDLCTVDLTAFYLDITKDALYTFAPDSPARRSVQTALYRIADALVRLIAPLLCFTAEEVWGYLPGRPAGMESVHLSVFPEAAELTSGLSVAQRERLRNWDKLIMVREEVLKALETARRDKFIGTALEARVGISAEGGWAGRVQEIKGPVA